MSEPVDLSKLLKPLSDVAINLLDKIEHAGAYFLPSKDIKESKDRACVNIIDEIANRDDIHPVERLAIVSNYKKIIKEYKNQTDILGIALENLKPDAKPDEVEDDWLNNFFDKARIISDDQMKVIWGKILTEEVNHPGNVSNQLVHILSIMNKSDAEMFRKLALFCYDIELIDNTLPVVVVFESFSHNNLGLNFYELLRCERLGLVSITSLGTNLNMNEAKLKYGNNSIIINTNETDKKSIHVGIAVLTDEAAILMSIIDRESSEKIFNFNLEHWQKDKSLTVIVE